MNQSTAKTLFMAAVFTIISIFAITVIICVRIRGSRISLPRARRKRRSFTRRVQHDKNTEDAESSGCNRTSSTSKFRLSLPSFPSLSFTSPPEISRNNQSSGNTTTTPRSSDSFSVISITPSNPVTVGYDGEAGRGIVTFILTPPTPRPNEIGGTFEGSMVIYEDCEDNEGEEEEEEEYDDDDENEDESPTGVPEQ